ncbi:MAG: ATPase [Chloroflexota bacterium]|nr:ATPase [Chloroflexota bacterium]
MIAIDILYLVDRLEALLAKGWRVPVTSKTMIDEDEFLDIVDQMRIAIPEEIKQAKKMVQDRERVLAQTQEEATRIVAMAKEDAARLVNEHAVTKGAEARAGAIEAEAKASALSIRQGADAYVAQSLSELQARLDQVAQQVAGLQTQVYNGLNLVVSNPEAPPETANREQNNS